MPQLQSQSQGERVPLSRERVLRGAVAVADAGGIGALTMRSLAHELGVKPMSLYHYVASKDEILDGIVDLVFSEIDLPSPGGDWTIADGPPGGLGPPGAAAPPLGDRAHGVAGQPRPGDAAPSRRHPRNPARRGLLGGNDRPRLRPARQLHLRIRPPGGISAVQPGDRHRGDRGVRAAFRRRVPLPCRDDGRAHPAARATTSAASSRSGSASSSTPSPGRSPAARSRLRSWPPTEPPSPGAPAPAQQGRPPRRQVAGANRGTPGTDSTGAIADPRR